MNQESVTFVRVEEKDPDHKPGISYHLERSSKKDKNSHAWIHRSVYECACVILCFSSGYPCILGAVQCDGKRRSQAYRVLFVSWVKKVHQDYSRSSQMLKIFRVLTLVPILKTAKYDYIYILNTRVWTVRFYLFSAWLYSVRLWAYLYLFLTLNRLISVSFLLCKKALLI